ncbi:hypothetical protein M422DRAFT_175013, partial [Sphaerobolus stellatus SS14]
PTSIAPLKNEYLFQSLSIPSRNYHCLNWWHNCDVTVQLPAAPSTSESESTLSTTPPTVSTTFCLHCTPTQHRGNHHLFDRWIALWGLWALKVASVYSPTNGPTMENKKLWFGGDTRYRSVRDGEDEDKLPVCPAFKKIEAKFGAFDLALIPIGAYALRGLLPPMHYSLKDSVAVFKDVKAKRALAMHWGYTSFPSTTHILNHSDMLFSLYNIGPQLRRRPRACRRAESRM